MVEIARPSPTRARAASSTCQLPHRREFLLLRTPRIGFFTTPSFLADGTPNSNQARVHRQPDLIVALGHGSARKNATLPPSTAPVDQTHAAPGRRATPATSRSIPMRQVLPPAVQLLLPSADSQSQISLNGSFRFRGVSLAGTTIFDLASQLAAHPDFAGAWVQKLCTWANSARCDGSDGEFARVAALSPTATTTGTRWRWRSSPLADHLPAADPDVSRAARSSRSRARDHLCARSPAAGHQRRLRAGRETTVVPQDLKAVQFIAGVLPPTRTAAARMSRCCQHPNFSPHGHGNICASSPQAHRRGAPAPRWSSGRRMRPRRFR